MRKKGVREGRRERMGQKGRKEIAMRLGGGRKEGESLVGKERGREWRGVGEEVERRMASYMVSNTVLGVVVI